MQTRIKFCAILLGINFLVSCGGSGGNGGGGGSTPPPTATLTANPTTITAGDSAQLIFTSTNANAGVIDNGVGPVGVNSQVMVNPTTTTTYMYSVTGPGGGTTASATVTVNAALVPTVNLTVSPGSIFAGQKPALTWQSTNATSVVIDNNIGNVQPASGGSVTLTGVLAPTQTTTYTATATGNGQQVTSLPVTVTVSTVNTFDGIVPGDSDIKSEQDIDPNGAVGTKQFLEYVNTEYQAFDKNPPYGPVTINGSTTGADPQPIGWPWQIALNGAEQNRDCLGMGIKLDTHIIFDRLASRWVMAAKAVRQSEKLHEYYLCVAVSNGDDVTSSSFGWYAYEYALDDVVLPKDSSGKDYDFPDWPKIGAWPDAYYVTMDMEDQSTGDTEVGIAVCALDRTQMLAGGTMQTPQCFTKTDPNLIDYLSHSLIPADFDGTTLPPTGQDEFLVSIQNPIDDGSTMTSNVINLWDFHVDWTVPANTTFTLASSPSVTTYTPGCYLFVPGAPALTNCATEPAVDGAGQTVDSVGDRLMPRFTYRNFGTYGSYLVSHTIQTGVAGPNPLQTGVRWYEMRSSQSSTSAVCDVGTVTLGTTPVICQSGTINPDAKLFRFLPSIAQDKSGNAAVGYSVSNSFTNPGIAFSYWSLGTLNADPSEVTILDGPGEEFTDRTGRGQWGSYSGMSLDPADDCTFWYVNEYWPTSAAWATRIANFKVPGCH